MTYFIGYDLYGGDLYNTGAPSYNSCCQECLMEPTCDGFSWEILQAGDTNSICYLKGNITPS